MKLVFRLLKSRFSILKTSFMHHMGHRGSSPESLKDPPIGSLYRGPKIAYPLALGGSRGTPRTFEDPFMTPLGRRRVFSDRNWTKISPDSRL